MVVVVTPGKEFWKSSFYQWFWSAKVVFTLFTNIFKAVFRNFPRKGDINMARDHNYHDALREDLNWGKVYCTHELQSRTQETCHSQQTEPNIYAMCHLAMCHRRFHFHSAKYMYSRVANGPLKITSLGISFFHLFWVSDFFAHCLGVSDFLLVVSESRIFLLILKVLSLGLGFSKNL